MEMGCELTFRHLWNTAWFYSEGCLPLFGCTSAAMLLILSAAELALNVWLLTAVTAHADHPLLPHQELATKPIAHHNDLHATCSYSPGYCIIGFEVSTASCLLWHAYKHSC